MSRFTRNLCYATATCVGLSLGGAQAFAANFNIKTSAGVFTPSFRGQSNTTWFGWESFDDPAFGNDNTTDASPTSEVEDWIIDDQFPDIGADGSGQARILGHNLPFDLDPNLTGVDHISSTRNIYTGASTLNETITAPTNGSVGTGYTTIIVQGVTAFGPLGGQIDFTPIDGFLPVAVQADNLIGSGQFWAKYEIPGNAATYDFTLTSSVLGSSNGENISLTRLVIDTIWSDSGFATDVAAVPEPTTSVLLAAGAAGTILLLRRRRLATASKAVG